MQRNPARAAKFRVIGLNSIESINNDMIMTIATLSKTDMQM